MFNCSNTGFNLFQGLSLRLCRAQLNQTGQSIKAFAPNFPGSDNFLAGCRFATWSFLDLASRQSTAHAAHIMAPVDKCLASMARLSLTHATRPTASMVPRYLAPTALIQSRQASVVRVKKGPVKKKAAPKDYRRHNLEKTDFTKFSLLEAMRYVVPMLSPSNPRHRRPFHSSREAFLISQFIGSSAHTKSASPPPLSNTTSPSTSKPPATAP